MARAVAQLAVAVVARTGQFFKAMNKVRRRLRKFSRSVAGIARRMAGFGKQVAKAFAGAGALAAGSLALRGEMFNRAMRQSQAIVMGLTNALDKNMRRAAIDAARTTVFSARDMAKAYFFLASAGLKAEQQIKALPVVAQFAQAGMFDMALATDLLTDAQSALGLTVANAQKNMLNMRHVGDVLVKANTLANASVQQFSESLTTKAGAALKILNKDIEEGVAVLAAFADQGVKSSDAGTALNIVLRELSTKAIKNANVFRRFGIDVFDSTGNMRNLAKIVASVEVALSGMSDQTTKATLLQLGFSDKSVIFLQTLIGMSGRIAGYEAALRQAGGTMAFVADRQLTPLQKALARLGAAWTDLAVKLSPVVRLAARLLDRLAKRFENLVKTLSAGDVRQFIRQTLNTIDLFVRDVLGKFARLEAGILSVFASITDASVFGVKIFGGAPAGLLQAVDDLNAFADRQQRLANDLLSGRGASSSLLGEKAFAIFEEMRRERGQQFAESIRRGLIDGAAKASAILQNALEKGGGQIRRFIAEGLVATSPLALAKRVLALLGSSTLGGRLDRAALPVKVVDFLQVSPTRQAFGISQRLSVAQQVKDTAAITELKGIRAAVEARQLARAS